jgi:hypothetical protein
VEPLNISRGRNGRQRATRISICRIDAVDIRRKGPTKKTAAVVMATASGNSLTADHLLYKTAINSQTMAAVCSSSLANFSNFPEGKFHVNGLNFKLKDLASNAPITLHLTNFKSNDNSFFLGAL